MHRITRWSSESRGTAGDVVKKLPDREKAKIADILLNNVRKNFAPIQLPPMVQHTPDNLAVDFWRVSSAEQRNGYSLAAQAHQAEAYKKAACLKSVQSWAVSESATREFDRRQFFAMLSYVVTRGIKNVICDKIDRACRGLRAAVLIEDLIESGVRFHFVRDNLVVDKHSSPSEKLRFYLGVVLAKWYIDNLRTEIKKGLHTRVKEGYLNARAPVGYVNVRSKFGKANLAVQAKVGAFISECFALYQTGDYSLAALAKLGMQRGVCWTTATRVFDARGRSKLVRKERCVSRKTLGRALVNPIYCQHRQVGDKLVLVKNAKWPKLTTYATFIACQKVRDRRTASRRGSRYARAQR